MKYIIEVLDVKDYCYLKFICNASTRDIKVLAEALRVAYPKRKYHIEVTEEKIVHEKVEV